MSNIRIRDRLSAQPGHSSMGGAVIEVAAATLVEDQPRFWRRIQVRLDNVVVPITAALDYGSVAVLDLSDGFWWIAGSHANFSVTRDGTGIVAATDVNWAIGTAAASNAALTAAMVDIRPEETFTTDALTDSVDTAQIGSTTGTAAQIAASTTSVHLNFAATLTVDGSMTVDGTIDLYALNFERP